MTDKEFEEKWLEERERLLKNDDEYQKALSEYKMTSGSDWLLFAIPVVGGIVSMNYIRVESELLKLVLAAVFAAIAFVVCVYVKSLTVGSRPLSDIEKDIKERFRREMGN